MTIFNENRRRMLLTGLAASGAAATMGSPLLRAQELSSNYAVEPVPRAALPVHGESKQFPIRRVYCLGRNYAEHAIEMGDDPDKVPPFFFMKPSDAVYPADQGFPYPSLSSFVSYEAELVVALQGGGANIAEEDALNHVYGYGVGLDMTRRDLQAEARELERPWEAGKSFDKSAPCSDIYPASQIGHPDKGRIWLTLNGEIKQESDLSSQRWSVSRAIAIISQYFELAPGDIILTGTPEGVGPVQRGDIIKAGVDPFVNIEVKVY
jgi:fumarylpyruvate hydrolase